MGIAWRPTQRWKVAMDGTFHGFVEYEDLGRSVTKLATGNLSAGTEYQLVEDLAVRVGAFTNLTSAPGNTQLNDLQPDRWDQYGGTVGFTYEGEYHNITVAGKFAMMRGTSSVAATAESFDTLRVRGHELGIIFGGGYYF
jgi:hypothetical protein